MAERYKISKYPGGTGYYIQDTYLLYSCSVDCFNVSDPLELEKARELQYRIDNGELFGVRIPGYAIYVHPSKNAYNSEHVKVTKNLLPSMNEMASFFLEKQVKPNSYLYYHSYVEDEDLLQPTGKLITRIEEAKTGPHFITVPKPNRTYIDGLVFEIKLSWLNQFASYYSRIYAKNKEGRLLTARIRLFDNQSVVKRKQCKRIVNEAVTGEKIVAKVKGYQILLIARTWKRDILSDEDVVVLLNQMASYFLTNEMQEYPRIQAFISYRDISDEEFDKKLANKEIRDDTLKRPLICAGIVLGIAIFVFLAIKGWLIGGFGFIMLLAYLGDMFARR